MATRQLKSGLPLRPDRGPGKAVIPGVVIVHRQRDLPEVVHAASTPGRLAR